MPPMPVPPTPVPPTPMPMPPTPILVPPTPMPMPPTPMPVPPTPILVPPTPMPVPPTPGPPAEESASPLSSLVPQARANESTKRAPSAFLGSGRFMYSRFPGWSRTISNIAGAEAPRRPALPRPVPRDTLRAETVAQAASCPVRQRAAGSASPCQKAPGSCLCPTATPARARGKRGSWSRPGRALPTG